MYKIKKLLTVICFLLSPFASATIITTGSGAATSYIDAVASFEDISALYSNPYIENGMSFFRQDLSFNNNNCGFAGCLNHTPFAGFSGNYMYGTGSGFFEIGLLNNNDLFYGLEFVLGTGFYSTNISLSWETYLNGSRTDSGVINTTAGTIVGFADVAGFNLLRFSENGFNVYGAAAFDSVHADLTGSRAQIPEPLSLALFGLGIAGLGFTRRKQQA
jgi:hypothetical protein